MFVNSTLEVNWIGLCFIYIQEHVFPLWEQFLELFFLHSYFCSFFAQRWDISTFFFNIAQSNSGVEFDFVVAYYCRLVHLYYTTSYEK